MDRGVAVTPPEMYREGSECCRNYSKLTMQVRTLASYLMMAYAVGIGTMGSQWLSTRQPVPGSGLVGIVRTLPAQAGLVLLFAGLALVLFAFSLWTVNWHYSKAFVAMRNVISQFEPPSGMLAASRQDGGPWRAHERIRRPWKDAVAWNVPFLALGVIGAISVWAGSVVLR